MPLRKLEADSGFIGPARRAECSNLSIRKARLGDLQSILQLYTLLFVHTDQAEGNAETMLQAYRAAFLEVDRDKNSLLFVAESSGHVLGTLFVTVVPNLSHRGRHWTIIENVVVDKEIQRASVVQPLCKLLLRLHKNGTVFVSFSQAAHVRTGICSTSASALKRTASALNGTFEVLLEVFTQPLRISIGVQKVATAP